MWVVDVVGAHAEPQLKGVNEVINFLGGGSESHRTEDFFWGRILTYSGTYYSYSGIFDHNYSALFNNWLFATL